MERAYLARDILDALEVCMKAALPPERCKHYRYAFTRGLAPADCPSITISLIDEDTQDFGDCKNLGVGTCEEWTDTTGLRIVLTDVCMGPDQQPTFDWELENDVATCFQLDFDTLKRCVRCIDWRQIRSDHSLNEIEIVGVTYDVETQGGGYSAYIEMSFTSSECCAP